MSSHLVHFLASSLYALPNSSYRYSFSSSASVSSHSCHLSQSIVLYALVGVFFFVATMLIKAWSDPCHSVGRYVNWFGVVLAVFFHIRSRHDFELPYCLVIVFGFLQSYASSSNMSFRVFPFVLFFCPIKLQASLCALKSPTIIGL